ncbi:hypothetical protein SAMN05216588_10648 [Pseudomonas flavescens]|uniref:Uncharacterized protein n=1 Tax=Phytopseudomonas flavescens TaxID=29435 RepID=A0A1G8E356_9GAMM|nr:DUF6138 family protein [Pseudomonas flavescens]SDH64079.1 hypothetical protein SAMN05216588_10648 [Pseudomonas flavescens]
MSASPPLTLDNSLAALERWFDTLEQRYAAIDAAQDSPLRAASHTVILNCEASRVSLEEPIPGLDDDFDPGDWHGPLQHGQAESTWLPALAATIRQRLQRVEENAPLSYRRIRVTARIATDLGLLETILVDHLNLAKQRDLLEQVTRYTEQILEKGNAPTEPLDTLFFCGHVLDPELFPEPDVPCLLRGFERIQQLNAGRQSLAEHRHHITHALRCWAEEQFLPRHFEQQRDEYRQLQHHPRADTERLAAADDPAHPLALLLYAATLILRFEPSYSQPKGLTFLELARQLGSDRAVRLLEHGSGAYPADATALDSAALRGSANDVLALLTLEIRQESADAYGQALAFITHLLTLGFPRHYRIQLKSSARHYLAVKGLARSDTHRFFANALRYPQLHTALERYARIAIQRYECYADAEAEKSCMPGSYATFGLALASEAYFPLLAHYMAEVDEEHQCVQDPFITAFVAQYGLTEASLPVLVACLRCASEALRPKIQPPLDDERMLGLLIEQLQELPPYSAEHVAYLLCGKADVIARRAKKATGEQQRLLHTLLQISGAT